MWRPALCFLPCAKAADQATPACLRGLPSAKPSALPCRAIPCLPCRAVLGQACPPLTVALPAAWRPCSYSPVWTALPHSLPSPPNAPRSFLQSYTSELVRYSRSSPWYITVGFRVRGHEVRALRAAPRTTQEELCAAATRVRGWALRRGVDEHTGAHAGRARLAQCTRSDVVVLGCALHARACAASRVWRRPRWDLWSAGVFESVDAGHLPWSSGLPSAPPQPPSLPLPPSSPLPICHPHPYPPPRPHPCRGLS